MRAPWLQRCSFRPWLLVRVRQMPVLIAESARARLTTLSRSRLGIALRRVSSRADSCAPRPRAGRSACTPRDPHPRLTHIIAQLSNRMQRLGDSQLARRHGRMHHSVAAQMGRSLAQGARLHSRSGTRARPLPRAGAPRAQAPRPQQWAPPCTRGSAARCAAGRGQSRRARAAARSRPRPGRSLASVPPPRARMCDIRLKSAMSSATLTHTLRQHTHQQTIHARPCTHACAAQESSATPCLCSLVAPSNDMRAR